MRWIAIIKAVIFDLDGTLLNRDKSVLAFINHQYDRLNTWLSHVTKESYTTRFIELDNGGYIWKDRVYQQLVEEFQITGLSWQELLQDYICQFKNYCVPFLGLKTVLEKLRNDNLKLGLITNGKGHFQLGNIHALGIEDYFDIILISEWEGIAKPNPLIFIKAYNKLDINPHEAIFVGDHLLNDIKAAQNVGMIGVWKKTPSTMSIIYPDYIIDQLVEIPSILSQLNN